MNINKIRTIIFPVGGFGTRFLPATKATLNNPNIRNDVKSIIKKYYNDINNEN